MHTMRILDQYLHPLFLDHDCIVVPELGGFVCNRQSAQYDEARQELTPPYRSVLFNERLVHHDGVLAQAVSRAKGITFDEAVKAIALEVDATEYIENFLILKKMQSLFLIMYIMVKVIFKLI